MCLPRLQGVVSVAYSPLGHVKDSQLLSHPAVLEVAAEAGKTPAQVGRQALGWQQRSRLWQCSCVL